LGNDEKVSISYLLSLKSQEWKIFDVLLAGSVSEVATKKSEFGSFIKKNNINLLIDALKKKNKELLK
jgi:phospholipid transport system substrate-binding protein